MVNILSLSIICCVMWISVCSGEDVVMQMFLKQPLNMISEKYISFSVDPVDLLEIYNNKKSAFSQKILELGPSYFKISGNSTNKIKLVENRFDENSTEITIAEWKKLYDSMRSLGLTPVIALPYDPKNWNARNVMQILNKSSKMNMNDCVWQLGADFRTTNAINYIDDLSTLRTMVDAFASKSKNRNWSVVGSDLTVGSSESDARLYSQLSQHIVEAIGWSQHNKIISFDASNDNIFSTLNIEPALRTVLNSKVPVWLSLTNSKVDSTTSDSICSMNCIQRGLSWAQTLGDASKKGFKMVYMPIEKNEWFKPSLTYYTTLLHKRIMGEKVFETKMMSGNRVETHMYAHCTKNMSGSFTIFGVNPADSKTHVAAKVPFKSGTEFSEYILTVNSATGKVQLNGNDIIEGSNLGPATRNKRPNKSAMLSMPPYSVGFWVFTMADLSECEQIQSAQETQSKNRILTSSEQLLQELILETVGRKDKIEKNAIKPNTVLTLNRSRRFINNNILRTKSRNSINKESNNELHKRHRRNIADSVRPRRSGHLINRIYNDIDDIKRRQILAPYGKYGSVLQKRSKRQVNSLSRLFEKFDFRKPGIGFKSPPFKLGPSAIPPIATVHDIYAANSAEKQIFRSIENHDIPTGDIHFEVGDEKSFDYVSVDDDGRRTEQRFVNSDAIHEVPDDVNLHRIPNQFFESFYGDSRLPQLMPQPNYNENPPVQHGELWEADAIDLSPPPSISAPVPVPMVINQAEQQLQLIPNANQQNIEFVVKELQPTWHKNRENLQKARNNLHKYYAPTIGNKNRHVKISSMLPNVAHSQKAANPLFADSEERIFFETRRRRKRAIDAKMNDEIEKKIQHNTAQSNLHADVFDEYLEDTVDKINLLDRILKIVGSIENNQDVKSNNNFNKFSNDIKKLEDFIYQNQKEPKRQTRPKMPSNEIQKKCKVLSMSLEQQCLQNEPMQNRAIFKRNIKIGIEEKSKKPSGIVKKILTQTKLGTDKRSMRQRRSVSPFEVDEIHLNEILNEIPKEFNEVAVVQHFLKSPVAKADKESVSKVAEMSPKAMKNNQEYVPKFLEVMKSSVDRVLDIVTRHVSGWWQSIS